MLRAAWGWARGCLLPHSILPGGCWSPGWGSKVLPEAGLSSSTGRPRSRISAGLPRIVFQLLPPPSADAIGCSQPKVQKKKNHRGSGIRQVKSCHLHHSPQAAQPIWQLIPAGNECPISQSPQKTLNKLNFAPFLPQAPSYAACLSFPTCISGCV